MLRLGEVVINTHHLSAKPWSDGEFGWFATTYSLQVIWASNFCYTTGITELLAAAGAQAFRKRSTVEIQPLGIDF